MGARGESTLHVGETEYRILFTNRALAEAQSAMGKGIIGVLQGYQGGESGVLETAHLLAAGLEAARRESRSRGIAYTVNDAYRIMDEVGFTAAAKATLEAVAAVLSYRAEGVGGDNSEAESPNP